MTKKDYELIARTIAGLPFGHSDKMKVADEFSFQLRRDNPRFNEEKFLKACNS